MLLCALVFFLTGAGFAEETLEPVYLAPDSSINLKQEYAINKKAPKNERPQKYNKKPDSLLISKKYTPLASPLSKDYIIASYTLKNTSEESVRVNLFVYIRPDEVIGYVKSKNERKRSPAVILDSADDFKEASAALYLFPPAGIALIPYSIAKTPLNAAKSAYNALLFSYWQNVNKNDIKLYEYDLKKFNSLKNNETSTVILNSGEETTFTTLIFLNRKQTFSAKYQSGAEYKFDI